MSGNSDTSANQASIFSSSKSKSKGKATATATSLSLNQGAASGDTSAASRDNHDNDDLDDEDLEDDDDAANGPVVTNQTWTAPGAYSLSDDTSKVFNSRKTINKYNRRPGSALLRPPARAYTEEQREFLVKMISRNLKMRNAEVSPGP